MLCALIFSHEFYSCYSIYNWTKEEYQNVLSHLLKIMYMLFSFWKLSIFFHSCESMVNGEQSTERVITLTNFD